MPDFQLSLLQEQDGLKTSDVSAIARDKEGYLWLASQSELQRFDGKNTLQFPFIESITSLLIDQQNRKWVVTRQHIYLYDPSSRRFVTVPVNRPDSSNMFSIYELPGKGVFIFNGGGHYQYNSQSKNFLRASPANGIDQRRTTAYGGIDGRSIAFGGRDSLYYWNDASTNFLATPIRRIYSITRLSFDEFLVSSSYFETFYVKQGSAPQKLQFAFNDQAGKPIDFLIFRGISINKRLQLLSTNHGLLIYDLTSKSLSNAVFYSNGRPLDNQTSINSFYKDSAGTIYMNHADGIYFLNSQSNFFFYLRNYQYGNIQMAGNDIRNFTEDNEGNIWMATTNGISRLDMKTGKLELLNTQQPQGGTDFPSYRQLLSIDKNIWIGTSGNGVFVYDQKTHNYLPLVFANDSIGRAEEKELSESYIWKIVKLKTGKVLIVGGTRSFLSDPQTLLTRKIRYHSSSFNSRSAIEDSAGRIWHGSVRGLTGMDSSFRTLFRIIDSFPDRRVASFCEWKRDRMLVGSKGLFEVTVNDNRVVSFVAKKGISPERLIYCMKKDLAGFVWIGTDDGLFRYDPVTDQALAFDQSDHIQSQAFNSDAAFLSKSGWMFMGGKNGLNYFQPEECNFPAGKLYPRVSSLAFNGNDSAYNTLEKIKPVPYFDRNIDFIISAPEFKKPYRLQYRYRFGNDSMDWVNTGFNNRVRISALGAGQYSLQASVSYDGKNWFDSAERISFEILKPWWQSAWFRLACLLLLAVIAWAIVNYLQKRKQERQLRNTIEYFRNSSSTNSSTDIIVWDIARNCIAALGLEDCVIYLIDEEREMLIQKAAFGDKNPRAFEITNPIEIPIGKGITGEVAKTGKSIVIGNALIDERYIVDDKQRYSEIAVPIIHEGRILGVIDSEHSRKNYFKEHHLNALETISTLSAAKIATAMALEATKKAENELTLLNGKMMESKFLNLRLQMNPHFLFNILTSIQYLVVSGQVNKATSYLNTFSGFLRSLLDYADDTVVKLDDELRILGMYIELESLCLAETFVWETTIDEEVDREEAWVPFMLLQPFIENAINHGLIHKVGEKKFSIHIVENNDDSLLCTIEDNGIGRAAAAAISEQNLSNVLHKSRGIGIVRERLELLQQKTLQKAGFEIEDLFSNGAACGTRVKIIIPYYINEEL